MKRIAFSKSVVLGAVAVLAAASCSKTDVYDSSALEAKQRADYSSNFIAKYGTVAPNQTWDFTKGTQLKTRADVTSITATVIDGLDFGISGNTFTKNASIYNAIKTVLPERVQHEGKPAVLVAPASSFYIFPISTQGRWTHDLMVKVGDQDPVKLYSKTWTDYSKPYVNGMTQGSATVDMKGLFVQAPVGTPIVIYIDNVNSNTTGPKPSVGTSTGQAIYVDVPSDVTLELPHGVDLAEDAVIKYVGIEDCTLTTTSEKTDNDYNDIVLAVVGNPDVPEEVIITNEEYEVSTIISKRYMVEDLGTTDDFDFNDIVVDVCQTDVTKHKVTYENNVLTTDEVTGVESSQKAYIRAMGGTLDFTMKIGDTSWNKTAAGFDATKMYNTNPVVGETVLAEFDVTSWNPDTNNVSVEVLQKGSDQVFTITFPKTGTVPMIIAVDPSQEWMLERHSVPSSWFYTVE